jgi:hypothetical protein
VIVSAIVNDFYKLKLRNICGVKADSVLTQAL